MAPPGPYVEPPLILDKCSVHHVDEVDQALSDCGVVTHYLPPYSVFTKANSLYVQTKQ
jgi:hypothetical protein